jgi:hypothetical protein
MNAATVLVCTDMLRIAAAAFGAGSLVRFELAEVQDGISRARGAAKYGVLMFLPVWSEAVAIVDGRGYPVKWSLGQVASFMSRSLPGAQYAVQIDIPDASKLPARWTDARLQSLAEKMAGLDPVAMRAEAEAKRATVASWADGGRKTAVLDAAARMDQCAALVDAIRAGDPFGAGGGGEGGMQ